MMLAIEVTSPSTRQNDFIDKLVMYGDAGFEQYIVIDIHHKGQIEILDFRPTVSYKPLARRADGRVLIESLDVCVETEGQNLAFTNPQTGERIADYPQAMEQIQEMTQQRDSARRIARNAKRLAKTASRKVKDAEQAKLDAEKAKLDAEEQAQQARSMLKLFIDKGAIPDLDPEEGRRLREILKDQLD